MKKKRRTCGWQRRPLRTQKVYTGTNGKGEVDSGLRGKKKQDCRYLKKRKRKQEGVPTVAQQ